MEPKLIKKNLITLAFYLFGLLWFFVGLTSYLYPRYPFIRMLDFLWLVIFTIPVMLFTLLTLKYAWLAKDKKFQPKNLYIYPYTAVILMFISLFFTFLMGSTHIFPRLLRWIAIAFAVLVVGIIRISQSDKIKLSLKAIYGEIFGITFVILYFFVIIWAQSGFDFGPLSFIDGVIGLIYGLFMGLAESEK